MSNPALEAVERELRDLLDDIALRDLLRKGLEIPGSQQPGLTGRLRSPDVVADILDDIASKNPTSREGQAARNYERRLRDILGRRGKLMVPKGPTNLMKKPTIPMPPKPSSKPTSRPPKPSLPTPPKTVPPPAPASIKGAPPKVATPSPKLGSAASWLGRVSPFELVMIVLDLHAAHFAALADMLARVEFVQDLLTYVEELEFGARTLRKAVNELWNAERDLPAEPLAPPPSGQPFAPATDAELAFVEQYMHAASSIFNDAWVAYSRLHKAIQGWDALVAQVNTIRDVARKAPSEAIIELNFRFSKQGRSFRGYLEDARDDADIVRSRANSKWYEARDILGLPY